ncbi:MAG: beta-ketoacyl-[acyl-carrier-protein] synthase family protein [Proteobacteria bacterium]|jgi:3-oxoacyl-(acyl-carrier-protein) synthase|nr:beta-ketoacyl-[acyl-carrier-protein] synthase family protein [Pseudomonadota bacterium]
MPRTRVAVTAVGAVSAAGSDAAAYAAALRAPRRAFGPPRRIDLALDVVVGEVDPTWFATCGWKAAESPTGALCLAAAQECAATGARRGAPKPDGLVLGTSTGGQSRNEDVVLALLGGAAQDGFSYRAAGSMASPARLVSRELGLKGPVQTVSTACTSSANAIALGAAWIRSGRCRAVLAGGGDALCRTTIASFSALELTGAFMCTPFGPGRPGLTLGEGAAFLLLEPLGAVVAEGRTPLAEIEGAGLSCDAHHMTAPPEDGAGAELAMRRALADAGRRQEEVHHVNAHGTGTKLNDAAEARAIARLFPSRPWVMSCKGLIGHTLGGAGALEAVAAVISIRERRAFENLGAAIPDPECDVALVGPGGVDLPEHPVVLSSSFAFGGNNCALVLSAADGGAR